MSSPLLWCFGLGGACRLAVSIVDGFILLYVREWDDELRFLDGEELVHWLDANEHQWAGLHPVARDYFEKQLPEQIERWKQEGGDIT